MADFYCRLHDETARPSLASRAYRIPRPRCNLGRSLLAPCSSRATAATLSGSVRGSFLAKARLDGALRVEFVESII